MWIFGEIDLKVNVVKVKVVLVSGKVFEMLNKLVSY